MSYLWKALCPKQSQQTTKCRICVAGFPIPCADGTFSNQTGMVECYTCPAGFYCQNTGSGIKAGTICPRGRYCPEGTNATIPMCPIGTYNDQYNMDDETDCLPCKGLFSTVICNLFEFSIYQVSSHRTS